MTNTHTTALAFLPLAAMLFSVLSRTCLDVIFLYTNHPLIFLNLNL